MATFGQGINPQLGAIDYSPILRGSLAGAQMAAQGSQMIGQGLANLGQEVGKGIQEYTKNKEERDMYSTGIESKMTRIGAAMQRFAEHPEEFGGVAPVSKEEYEKYKAAVPKWGGGSIGTLKSGYAEISALEDRVQKAPEVALRNLNLVAARNDQEQTRVAQESIGVGLAAIAAGKVKDPLEAIRAAGYNVNEKVASYFANLAHVKAQTGLAGSQGTLADATAFGKLNPVAKQPTQYVDIYQGLRTKHIAETGRLPTPTEDSNYQFQAAQAGRAQTVINMGGSALEKVVGEGLGQDMLGEYRAAKDAPEAIAKLDEIQGLIKSGNITTGIGAEYIQNANRLRAQFSNDIKAGKTVSNTQLLESLLGSDVFPMISALGIGAKGMDTPAEREFLRQSFTGTKDFTPETLQRLTQIRRDIQMRAIKKFKKNNASGAYKKLFDMGAMMPDFSAIPPEGVTSQQWSVMTPEAKALFPESK